MNNIFWKNQKSFGRLGYKSWLFLIYQYTWFNKNQLRLIWFFLALLKMCTRSINNCNRYLLQRTDHITFPFCQNHNSGLELVSNIHSRVKKRAGNVCPNLCPNIWPNLILILPWVLKKQPKMQLLVSVMSTMMWKTFKFVDSPKTGTKYLENEIFFL